MFNWVPSHLLFFQSLLFHILIYARIFFHISQLRKSNRRTIVTNPIFFFSSFTYWRFGVNTNFLYCCFFVVFWFLKICNNFESSSIILIDFQALLLTLMSFYATFKYRMFHKSILVFFYFFFWLLWKSLRWFLFSAAAAHPMYKINFLSITFCFAASIFRNIKQHKMILVKSKASILRLLQFKFETIKNLIIFITFVECGFFLIRNYEFH